MDETCSCHIICRAGLSVLSLLHGSIETTTSYLVSILIMENVESTIHYPLSGWPAPPVEQQNREMQAIQQDDPQGTITEAKLGPNYSLPFQILGWIATGTFYSCVKFIHILAFILEKLSWMLGLRTGQIILYTFYGSTILSLLHITTPVWGMIGTAAKPFLYLARWLLLFFLSCGAQVLLRLNLWRPPTGEKIKLLFRDEATVEERASPYGRKTRRLRKTSRRELTKII